MLERHNPESPQLDMPPVDYATHLLEWFFEVGPCERGGMSPSEISFREIQSWQDTTGVWPTVWEVLTLRRLSKEFVNFLDKAKEKNCPAPWPLNVVNPDNRKKVAAKLSGIFDNLERSKKKKLNG